MRILIIRHAEPDYSKDSLTLKGFKEAEYLADRLEKMNIGRVFCSPLGRAKDTIRPYCKRTGKKAIILPWLQEFRGSIYTDTQ